MNHEAARENGKLEFLVLRKSDKWLVISSYACTCGCHKQPTKVVIFRRVVLDSSAPVPKTKLVWNCK